MWFNDMKGRYEVVYFITFIDYYTRFGHVNLISHEFEAWVALRNLWVLVENQLDMKIKALRSDRGWEYLPDQFRGRCDEKGIERLLTIPTTPQ